MQRGRVPDRDAADLDTLAFVADVARPGVQQRCGDLGAVQAMEMQDAIAFVVRAMTRSLMTGQRCVAEARSAIREIRSTQWWGLTKAIDPVLIAMPGASSMPRKAFPSQSA